MSIFVNDEEKLFFIETNDISYVMCVNRLGILETLYFGKKVGRDDLRYICRRGCRGYSASMPDSKDRSEDANQFRAECSTSHYGDYRVPTVMATFEDGSRVVDLRYEGYEINATRPDGGMPTVRDGETLKITLVDKKSLLKVNLYYTVYQDLASVVRSLEIVNEGDETVMLDRAFSFCIDLPNQEYKYLSLNGAHMNERQICVNDVIPGVYTVESSRGTSSPQHNPFIAILGKNATETEGEAFGFNLIYSGSFQISVELNECNLVRVAGGVNSFDFCWELKSGASFVTPECAICYSSNGIGAMSRTFHDLYRDHLINPNFAKKPRPIVINNWEGTYFDFTEEKLCAMIESVKGKGIDTFVLDDGWFGHRDNDYSSLGDWFVYEKKLPNGLKPIAQCCRRNGLKFGLWFEPEMVNRDSVLFETHPEWTIQSPGRPICKGREQYVLDITREDVREYIKKVMTDIIRENDVEYVKWDMNRSLTECWSQTLPSRRQKEFMHRYCLGYYDLLRYFEKEFPNLIIEGCASGGGRFDAGQLAYTPQVWTSDNSDAYHRTKIQYGTSICYPLSAMSCHVSVSPNHQTGRITSFKSRCQIAYFGATGYEFDPTKITEEEMQEIVKRNEEYRRDEEIILTGDLYRINSPFDTNFFTQMVVSKDKSKAIAVSMQVLADANGPFFTARLQGLDADATYKIVESGETFKGSTLMGVGINLPFCSHGDFATAIWHFEKID